MPYSIRNVLGKGNRVFLWKKRSFGSPRIELQCWWVSFQWSSCAVPWYPSWLWCETWPKMTKKAVRMAKKLPLEWENYRSCVCLFFLCFLRFSDSEIFVSSCGNLGKLIYTSIGDVGLIHLSWKHWPRKSWVSQVTTQIKTFSLRFSGTSAVLHLGVMLSKDKTVNVDICQTHGFQVLPVGWFDC